MEWHDAPHDYERPVLELESTGTHTAKILRGAEGLSVKSDDTFNPYERLPEPKQGDTSRTQTRRDLRKLSEWIKLMRELEEKKNGSDTEE